MSHRRVSTRHERNPWVRVFHLIPLLDYSSFFAANRLSSSTSIFTWGVSPSEYWSLLSSLQALKPAARLLFSVYSPGRNYPAFGHCCQCHLKQGYIHREFFLLCAFCCLASPISIYLVLSQPAPLLPPTQASFLASAACKASPVACVRVLEKWRSAGAKRSSTRALGDP